MVKEIKTLGDASEWLERRGTKPDEIRWMEPIRQRIIDWLRSNQAGRPGFQPETARHGARAGKMTETTSEPQRAATGIPLSSEVKE
jgi:hypothetical protein